MAFPRIRLNEGSLLRRTMLHVATFVVGSMTFIGIVSVTLCSIAKGLVSPHAAEASEEETLAGGAGATTATPGRAAAPFPRPGVRPGANRRLAVPGVTN